MPRYASRDEKHTWRNIVEWDRVLPPSRPSAFHLTLFEEWLRPLDRELPLGILGSTPEFRDLVYRLRFRHVWVLDKYPVVYKRMSRLRSFNTAETFICGDWIDVLRKQKETFVAILSDLTSGNLPYERHRDFYSAISSALVPGGLFLDKILTFARPKLQLRSLLTKYHKLPPNLLYVNHFSCEVLFCSTLLNLRERVDSTLFYSILEERCRGDENLETFLAQATHVTPLDTIWYYGRPWKRIEPVYHEFFRPLHHSAEERLSPFAGFVQLFASRSKNL